MSGGVDFAVALQGDTRLLIQFDKMPGLVHDRVRATIGRLVAQLLPTVKAAEPFATGRLRSLTHSYVDVRPNWVRGRVRVLRTRNKNTAAAGGALEYGAHRRFTVRAHFVRRVVVFGRPVSPRVVRISPYQRRANVKAVRFLRNAARAQLPAARAALEAAIAQALRDLA